MLNLDYGKTSEAFKAMGFVEFDAMYSQFRADELFAKLETGQVTDADFYTVLQKVAPKEISREQLTTAWCAMLLDFRVESLAALDGIRKRYNIYLLSNTNSIHLQAFHRIYEEQFGSGFLDDHFTKAYYSHHMGLRKPDSKIYSYVLEDAGINAAETVFIDDSWINLPPAEALGIRTHLLQPGERIEALLLP